MLRDDFAVRDVFRARRPHREKKPAFDLDSLSGRFIELSARDGSAVLTLATTLVREAQLRGGLTAWVCTEGTQFYPPDLEECGIDLDQFPVIVLQNSQSVPLAADHLLRAGAFSLVVLDLGETEMPLSQQTRLTGLAKRHSTALLCLTSRSRSAPSLGSLVSLRGMGVRRALRDGRFVCELEVLKDKQGGLGWKHTELRRGPNGLC